MRVVTMILVVLALIVSLGAWSNYTIKNSSQTLYQNAKNIEQKVDSAQWSAASASMHQLDRVWNRTKYNWMIFVDHREIDGIETSLARLDSVVKSKNMALTRSELANLLQLIKHIPEKEAVNLRNVL